MTESDLFLFLFILHVHRKASLMTCLISIQVEILWSIAKSCPPDCRTAILWKFVLLELEHSSPDLPLRTSDCMSFLYFIILEYFENSFCSAVLTNVVCRQEAHTFPCHLASPLNSTTFRDPNLS